MDKMQLSKDRRTLEAEDISGRIFIYIDDKPFVKLNFSRKLRIYFDCISNESQAFTAESHSHGKASLESNGSFLKGELSYSHSKEKDQKLKKYVVNNQKKENTLCFSNTVKNKTQSFEQPIEQTFKSEVINLDAPLPAEFLHAPYACSTTTTFSSTDNTTFSSLQLQCPKKTFPQPESSCSYCHKAFLTCSEKEAHHRVPDCVRQCKQCEKKFTSAADLFLHHYRKHDRLLLEQEYPAFKICDERLFNEFQCPICNKHLLIEKMYHHVQATHFSEESYFCCVCSSTFKTHSCLHSHLSKHHLTLSKAKEITSYNEFQDVERCNRVNLKVSKITDKLNSQLESFASKKTESSKEQSLNNDKSTENLGLSKTSSSRSMLSCRYCDKIFSKRSEKVNHKKVSDLKIKCPKCPSILKSQASLIIHDFQVHDKSLKGSLSDIENSVNGLSSNTFIRCPLCQKQTNQLEEHIAVFHINEMLFQCCVCGQKFLTDLKLRRHCYRHLKKTTGKFHCSRCPMVTDDRSVFLRHAATHRTECAICNTDFGHTHLLWSHYQSQHADKLFTCKTCGKKVATKDQFDTHMNYHRFSSKPCPICGIMIKSNLNKHLQRKHPEMNQTSTSQHSDNQHTCSKCFKTFSSHVNLSEHLRRNHHNQVACPNCGKKFSKKAYLTKHIDRVHLNMDVYTYICEICGKRVTSSYNLKVHKRVHSTSKMFSCDLCGQGFNYKASLQGHVRSKHKRDLAIEKKKQNLI